MTGPDRLHRRRDQDEDPTGVQALLSGLPGPGPMPEDLVARINESLREEASRRDGAPDQVPYALFAGRSRGRSRGPWVAVAAASAAAIVLGGGLLTAFGGALPSQLGMLGAPVGSPPGPAGPADPTGPAPSGVSSRGSTEPGHHSPSALPQGEAPGAGAGAVTTFTMSGVLYAPSTLRAQARSLADRQPSAMRTLAAEAPAVGPIATPLGLASCLRALGLRADVRALVDIATYDDEPVAVLVTETGDGDQVHVVRRSCTEGSPDLIAGPYLL